MTRYMVILLTIFLSVQLFAATKSYPVTFYNPRTGCNQTQYYSFSITVVSDDYGTKGETTRYGKPFVYASPNEKYSITIYNPLPIRVACNLTIDGLSSITGSPVNVTGGSKWVIQPNSSITISGWQVSNDNARRFYFTSKANSYAKWRSNAWGKDLSVNCGVIGAAFFWSQAELNEYYRSIYRPEPIVYDDESPKCGASRPCPDYKRRDKSCESAKENNAGTGMGERYGNSVTRIYFNYDRGMYSASDAVVVYYDFGSPEYSYPNAFSNGYAPEY